MYRGGADSLALASYLTHHTKQRSHRSAVTLNWGHPKRVSRANPSEFGGTRCGDTCQGGYCGSLAMLSAPTTESPPRLVESRALLHFTRRQDVLAWTPAHLAGRDQRSVRNVTE